MKQDEDSKRMVPIDQDQDKDLFLGIQGTMVLEDSLDIVDQGEMVITIDHDWIQGLNNLQKLSLAVLDANVEHVTK